jgi:hypothetical protein
MGLALLPVMASGCLFPPSSSTPDGGRFGFGQPTLLLTAGGLRIGPVAPDPGSVATLRVERDSLGRLTRTSLSVTARAQAAGGACQLYVERFGVDLQPFAATSYTIAAPTTSATIDGTVSVGAGLRVDAQGIGLVCSGSACDGGTLALTGLDAQHVEGFYSGQLLGESGQGSASVVCSFWLPRLDG